MPPTDAKDGDKIRIAIAICALNFKPTGQSYGAYVLDLRERFPEVGACWRRDSVWKERALAYEKKLNDLRESCDADRIELTALRARKSSPPPGTGDPALKKKGKKKTQQIQERGPSVLNQGDLQSILVRLDGDGMPHVASASMLGNFQRLQWISESEPSIDNHSKIISLHGVIKSAILSLSGMLQPVLSTTPGPRQPSQVLEAVESLLDHLLETMVDLIAALVKRFSKGRGKTKTLMTALCTAFDEILGSLGELVLVPIVRAVWPLCRKFTAMTLGKGKEKGVDVRMKLLAILRKGMLALEQLRGVDSGITSQVQSLHDRIALEGIREMMAVFTITSICGREGWSERLKRLARKDAVWALCGILLVAGGGGTPGADQVSVRIGDGPGPGPGGGLLRRELMEQMGALVRGMTSASEVERNMVLGVVERVWVDGIGSGCIHW